MTARNLIKSSLRQLGILADGEEPTDSQAEDALDALNGLLESWSIERLMVFQVAPQTFSLVANKKAYTLGPGGDFDAPRPVRVEKVQLNYAATNPEPLNIPIEILDLDQYQQIVLPDTATTFPLQVYIDNGYPSRNLFFYPVPNTVNTVDIFTWQTLTSIDDLDADIAFPLGYARALKYGLAVEIADEYGVSISQVLASKASDSKAKIKSQNTSVPLMQVDPALTSRGGAWNWRTGQ